MFNDRYGLTQAVLRGIKTHTRRICKEQYWSFSDIVNANENQHFIFERPKFSIGEVVAIAQPYRDTWIHTGYKTHLESKQVPGYDNKMFVRADLMPHQIRIIGVKVERLQDISGEDCIKEGIYMDEDPMNPQAFIYTYPNAPQWFFTPREAYAALIDRISGKGTWPSNPFVFAYDFKLVK